ARLVQRVAHEPGHFVVGVLSGRMLPVPIGAFDLEAVHILDRLRVAQNVVVASADVAAEKKAACAARFMNVEDHLGGAQDVTGIAEGYSDAVEHGKYAIIVDGNKLANGLLRVAGGVKRLD